MEKNAAYNLLENESPEIIQASLLLGAQVVPMVNGSKGIELIEAAARKEYGPQIIVTCGACQRTMAVREKLWKDVCEDCR